MKLHRDLKVTQKTAWFMLHRIREVWNVESDGLFAGPVEVDETYMGGREGNKHAHKKQRLGRGGIGKSVVVGAKDWTHPGKVEAPYTVCIASASNLTGLVKSSVECRRTGL